MAVDHVKSTFITNLDASPAVINTAGEGAAAPLYSIEGYATSVALSSVDATYQLVRVPSNCKIKSIHLDTAAMAGGTFDFGLYYATDTEGNQPTALLAAAVIHRTLFASAVDLTNALARTDITNESTLYTIDRRVMPLWQASNTTSVGVALTSDPGGYFDIVATVVSVAVTNAGRFGITVTYTQ